LVSLQDVDFEFRAYYRVELGEVGATGPSKPVPPPRHVAQATNHDDFVPVPADTQAYEAKPAVWNVGVATDPALPSDLLDGEEVGANVRRGLFGR
jgi:hypothetical protein